MTTPGITAIRIVKGGTVFHVHGEDAGAEGVWLAKGQVEGLYDAPVKTTWKTGAFQVGSSQRGRKFLHRDMTLGFHIKETVTSWEFNDSQFRRIFDYEEDPWDDNYQPTTIEVETTLSGVRKIDVLMSEPPDFDTDLDPQMQQHGNVIFKLRSGQPMWYQDDYTSRSNTSVAVQNPTDQIAFHKWELPVGTLVLPDREWQGAPGARTPVGTRTVTVPVPSGSGGAVVDLDRSELMFRDANNTNILAQLAGKFFEYPIPPYTPPTNLAVSGGSVLVRIPVRWSRPWGLELWAAGSTPE